MVLWLLACTCAAPSTVSEPEPPALAPVVADPREDVLVIVIDTLRADALRSARTPHLDTLEQRVDRAWSSGTWTVPSVVALFTGAPVRQHGFDLPTGRIGKYPQLPDMPTLAEVLKQQGFTTTGLYSNTYLAEELGFGRGFDTWRRVSDKVMPKYWQQTLDDTWADGQRDFAYLHLLGPHSPLRPTDERREKYAIDPEWFEERMGLEIGVAKRNRRPGARTAYSMAYSAVIEDTDDLIGQILDALGPRRDDTLIVVTSDHGELLGEHDTVGHGYWVWEGLTHVPMRFEGHAGEVPETLRLDQVASLVTWNAGIQQDWPSDWQVAGPLVSQREGKLALSPDGVVKGVWHTDALEVYDLAVDPGEEDPLPGRDAQLQAARGAWEADVPLAAPLELVVELEDETLKGLQELGYVEEEPTDAPPAP